MTSFSEVRRATCEIVADDATRGTAFVVHPDGFALTCHHVVYGLDVLKVRFPDLEGLVDADYVAEWSDPSRDVAVLRIEERASGPYSSPSRAMAHPSMLWAFDRASAPRSRAATRSQARWARGSVCG